MIRALFIASIRHVVIGSFLIAPLIGCGGDDAPPIGEVSGTVTHNGQPLPGVTVNFMPENGRPSWGLTDESGYYSLHWDADHDGAEVGRHKVSVAYVPKSPMDQAGYETVRGGRRRPAPKKAPAGRPEAWPEIERKYGLETTQLTKDVQSGSQTIDLALD